MGCFRLDVLHLKRDALEDGDSPMMQFAEKPIITQTWTDIYKACTPLLGIAFSGFLDCSLLIYELWEDVAKYVSSPWSLPIGENSHKMPTFL